MSRLHGADENIAALQARLSLIPAASVVAGSLVSLAPLVAQAPILPPIGFMLFLCWRFLRPEIWPLWAGLPLGLFDDLMSGNPLGTAMLLWTVTLLAFEFAENRTLWRDYWMDWVVATAVLSLYILLTMALSAFTGGGWLIAPLLPQILVSVLLVPLMLRFCAMLDGWRLSL